jgi:hypothetical protein
MANEEVKVSKSFSINVQDLLSVGKHALIVAASAGLTAVVDSLGHIQMGESMLIVIPLVSMSLKALLKYLETSVYAKKPE